jgi:hypothetical protein
VELRLETARDVLEVLGGELSDVRRRMPRGTAERARVAGYLCSLLLRSFEQVDLAERLEALEAALAGREVVQ